MSRRAHNGILLSDMPRGRRRQMGAHKVRVKKCARCGEKQPVTKFAKHSTSSDGRASYCNNCRNLLGAKRRKTNLGYKLRHHIHSRIIKYTYTHGIPKGLVTDLEVYLNYTMLQLKRHLSADLFDREGITLREAFDKGYHLDHMKPLSSFAILDIGDEEFRRCWAMDNLRMITAEENLAKGAKVL